MLAPLQVRGGAEVAECLVPDCEGGAGGELARLEGQHVGEPALEDVGGVVERGSHAGPRHQREHVLQLNLALITPISSQQCNCKYEPFCWLDIELM